MQESRLKIRGLYTLQNPYSEVPEGALEVADDIVIDRDSLAGPRRGFDFIASTLASNSDRAKSLYEYQDKLLVHYASKLAYHDGSAYQVYSGSYDPPDYGSDDGAKIRFAESNQNLYFTTNAGIKKLDVYSGTIGSSGMAKALGATASLISSGSVTVNTGCQVAYRIVWGITDANNNVILGAPSQRIVVTDAGGSGARDVQLVVDIPSGITTSNFVQIYRSFVSAGASIDPGDELYLVYEAFPTSSDISAKQITITDSTPEDLLGESLYTSPSQEGILMSNEQPPLAKDLAVFKNYMFYANTVSKHRKTITYLGGLQNNDTITIAGTTYTAKTSASTSTQFTIATGGSAAENIQDTAQNLVSTINRYSSNTSVYAFYLSGPDDLPGKILLEERGLGGSAFTIQASRVTSFSPDTTSAVSSENDTFVNAIYISKFQEPEAVPTTQVFRVGSANDPILRIVPLRGSMLIFKEKEGVYRLTGEDVNSFTIDLYTSSTRLLAKNTCAVLNNTVYALTDQGVTQLTENNIQVVSRPIEDSLLELFGSDLAGVQDLSWAVAYESDRKYILNIISTSTDTYTTQAFVWNVFTNTWTRWVISKSAGYVRPSDNFLYVGDATSNKISKERKNFSFRDNVDEAMDVTVSAVSGKTITTSGTETIAMGDIYYESDNVYGTVTAVDNVAGTITVDVDAGFSAGSHSVLRAFESKIKWAPFSAGSPMDAKHFREVSFLFDKDFVDGEVAFTTELSTSEETVPLDGTAVGLFGLFPFGTGPFGGQVPRRVARTYVPLEKRRAAQLSVEFRQSIGYSDFRLAGLSIMFNPIGSKVSHG